LRELLGKATPGEWQAKNDCEWDEIVGNIDGPDAGQFHYTHVCSVDMDDLRTPEYHANAAIICASINFLRSAAFDEMVRNDARYRWLRERHDDDTTDSFWHVRDHNAHPVARGKLDTAIDTAMSAEGANDASNH
jgi:hypothetical protein